MSFYSNLKSVASRILKDKGQNVTFTQETETGFNPATGVKTKTTSTFTGYGAAFDYKRMEIDGELVQKGDIRFLMEATTVIPVPGNTTVIDSIAYRVMAVKITSPAGTAVIYEVQLRR